MAFPLYEARTAAKSISRTRLDGSVGSDREGTHHHNTAPPHEAAYNRLRLHLFVPAHSKPTTLPLLAAARWLDGLDA
jgi:hypothetical protein